MPARKPSSHRTATLIADLGTDERPRERLLQNGPQALSDSELVAVLLRGGRPGCSVLEQAREILEGAGGLVGLASACPRSLCCAGMGPVKTAALLASVEIARRMAAAQIPDRKPLSRPTEVATYLDLRYGRRDQEVMGVLFLDGRNRLLAEEELFRGTLSRSTADPRTILRRGLVHNATALMLFHTHPSGDPSPSQEDIHFTRRMADAGDLIGIGLVDHLIVAAGGRWTSMRAQGLW
ncbi:MAG: DNA repair protein RadC [Acidobacteriota bacterium]